MKVQIPICSPSSSSCIFLACFMVTCCIDAQARQPFYRYSCLVRLLKCFLSLVLCPSSYHDELILTKFKFLPTAMNTFMVKKFAVICAVTQQITMEYAGKNALSEARGKWKCPWNLPTLVINRYFQQRSFTALKPRRILHMQENCRKLVFLRALVTYMPSIPELYVLYKKKYIIFAF